MSPRRAKRSSISIGTKLEMLRQIAAMQSSGSSLRSAAKAFNIQGNQVRRWRKQFGEFNNNHDGRPGPQTNTVAGITTADLRIRNMKAKSFCTGRVSLLEPFEDDILQWLFSLREQGMPVSIAMVALKARKLVGSIFRSKSERAQYMICYRFLASHKYGIRIGTHVSQRAPSEVCQEAKAYVEGMRSSTMQDPCRDPWFILNMDQTPVFFTMTPNTTLEKKGGRTVNIRSYTSTTSRISVALTVTASGDLLRPFLVFKGKPNGRIDKKELKTFPPEGEYTVQEKAWMDSVVMFRWIETIVKPFLANAIVPAGIRPLLLLDSYRCHMMGSVVSAINELGIDVEHIPGGCTGLCQPIDVGVGKPFKTRVRKAWQEWMLEKLEDGGITAIPNPTRREVTDWVLQSIAGFSGTTICYNSW